MIILNNPDSLLDDECKLIKRLGLICPQARFQEVTWLELTGRVSASWKLTVSDQISLVKWGIIALPNDERKRAALLSWMKSKPEKVKTAYDELRRDGYVL